MMMMLFAVPDIAPSHRGVPRCACCCCVFEHIAHAIEGGGVKIDLREDDVDLPRIITTDHSACAPGALRSRKPQRHLVYQIRPPPIIISYSYMVLLHTFSQSCYLTLVGGYEPWL